MTAEEWRGRNAAAAFEQLKVRVHALGGVVLEPVWLGCQGRHRVRCSAGHETTVRPNVVRKPPLCVTCTQAGFEATFRQFCADAAEAGATVLDPWLGKLRLPHRVRCAVGHETTRSPTAFYHGKPLCSSCSPKPTLRNRAADWAKFQEIASRRSVALLEDDYLGYERLHRMRCSAGHEFGMIPSNWLKREPANMCRQCASEAWAARSPAPLREQRVINDEAELAFRAKVAGLGGSIAEWRGAGGKADIRCPAGHVRGVWVAHLMKGLSPLCSICTGRASVAVEQRFRDALERQGAALVDEYRGTNTPALIRCANGHETSPYPGHVLKRLVACSTCVIEHDAFYVVLDMQKNRVKFGITSGDHRRRLYVHERNGYNVVARLLKEMRDPRKLEDVVVAALRDAGHRPIRGREYFDICTLGLIFDLVDNYPIERRQGEPVTAERMAA